MIHRICFWIFLVTILLAPLPFGANRPWSWSLLAAITGFLLVVEGLSASHSPGSGANFLRRIAPGLLAWLLAALWAVLQQGTALPSGWTHPLHLETQALIGRQSPLTISLDTVETGTAIMRFLTYGAVFWLAARFCRDTERARITLQSFAIAATVYASYGLAVHFAGWEMILWFDKWTYRTNLVSTFVNRNSYATYAGLGALCTATLAFRSLARGFHAHQSVRQMSRAFVDGLSTRSALPVAAFVIIVTSLLLTHSRGGFLSGTLGLIVLLVCLSITRTLPRKLVLAVSSVAVISGIYAFSLSGDIVVDRLQGTSFLSSLRDEVYKDTITAITTNPVLGTGYGTYEYAFLAFKSPEIARLHWDKAHNSYLELAMELGLPAALLIFFCFAWLAAIFLRGLMKRQRRRHFAAIGLSITVLVAAHALVDFSLQIPGLAVSYALLAGMAWAQSWPSASHRCNHHPDTPIDSNS